MIRWISGMVSAIIVVFLLLYVPQAGLQFIVVIMSVMAFSEYFNLTQQGVCSFTRWAGLLLCALATFSLIFWAQTPDHFLTIFSFILIATFLLHFRGSSDLTERVRQMVFYYFGIMYLSLLFSYWGWMRALDQWRFWIFLLLAGTFLADTGGYLIGHWMGRHKLAPTLSPGKTIEGFLGGWLFCLAGAFIVRFLFLPSYSIASLVMISSLIAFVGPLGDLSESLIKRGVHAKDSGNFMPGHGGFLDRIDALLFTAPVVYYFAKYVG